MSPRGQQSMGGFGVPPLTKGVKAIGIVTLVLSIVAMFDATAPLMRWEIFEPSHLKSFWTPFTYTLVDPDPRSIIFDLLGLWLMGSALEQRWGTRRFVIFYFASGALAALATFAVSLVAPSVAITPYFGNAAPLAAMAAAFSVQYPDAVILLIFIPVPGRWILPLSAAVTGLFMIKAWQPYLPQLFGLGAGVLLAGGISPEHLLLRARVWWIDRRLRRSKLRIVRGIDGPDEKPSARGSDKYLH
jgi:membrane associated rhomboid family serine protease